MARLQLERVNFLWFLTLGVTTVAAGLLIYILLLESALGAFSIREANPLNVGKSEKPRVALLNSDYTRRAHLALNPGNDTDWIDVTLRSWSEFLLDRAENVTFEMIGDDDVENGDLDGYTTLILPSTRALSDRQIDAIKDFMNQGGSVLATWTPGIYYPDGTWRGWSFIEEAFGVSFVDFVERGNGNYRVYQDTFPGSTPPGLYRPEYVFEQSSDVAGLNDTRREFVQRQAREADFPPLRGYRWVDTWDGTAAPPQGDYAIADTVSTYGRDADGRYRRQRAVAVTYYTWTGGKIETQTPYPYTGAGIRRFTLRGNTPLTAHIPPGYRVKVQVYNPGVRMRVLEPRTVPVGFWYDFAVEDRVISDALNTTTGIVYGTYGKGRFVYLGMQRDAMGVGREDREDYQQLGTLFTNIMRYLQREPVIWLHDWPHSDEHPYTAAAVLSGTGDDDLSNLSGVADLLDQENVPGTYFVRPDAAAAQRNLIQRLYQSGDVGVLDDLIHDRDGSKRTQRDRLERLKNSLSETAGGAVTGYKPTGRGEVSDNTMGALTEAGYTYFMPDSIGRRMVPKIMGEPFETLTRIGVTAHGDREIFGAASATAGELPSIFFQEDITRVQYEGGLYNLNYSSDILGAPENRGVLRSIVRSLKDQNFWVTSADELAHWWRLRQGLDVEVEQRGPHRLVMRVSNNNGSVADEIAVSIALGKSYDDIRVQPELIGVTGSTPKPTAILRNNNSELVLIIEKLKPQQNRIFHIDLEDEETRAMFSSN